MNEIRHWQLFESMVEHVKLMHIRWVFLDRMFLMPMIAHQPTQSAPWTDLIRRLMDHRYLQYNQKFDHGSQHKAFCSLAKYTGYIHHNFLTLN